MRLRLLSGLLLGLLGTLPLAAMTAEAPKQNAPSTAPPPPRTDSRPAPPEGESGLEPEVTIVTRGDVTFEEYRVRGRHYMTKVIPKNGKPYYLIDKEGSGQFRRSDTEATIAVPSWIIKSW